MDKNEFAAYIQQNITGRLPAGEYPEGTLVTVVNAEKSGGRKLTGISIRRPGENISPCVYLDEYYMDYRNRKPAENILEEIVEEDRRAREGVQIQELTEEDLDFEMVWDRIYMQVCDTRMSRGYLNERPHIEQGDYSATYHILIAADGAASQSIGITDALFNRWKISKEELHRTALANMRENTPARMYEMDAMLGTSFGREAPDLLGSTPLPPSELPVSMYILKYDVENFGASCVFDSDAMERASLKLGADCFVLPASKHEVLLVPDNGRIAYEELCEIVQDVNFYTLRESEFLSDCVQYYDRAQKKMLGQQEYLERRQRLNRQPRKEQEIKQNTPKI